MRLVSSNWNSKQLRFHHVRPNVYDILAIFDESWKKKEEEEDRKVL